MVGDCLKCALAYVRCGAATDEAESVAARSLYNQLQGRNNHGRNNQFHGRNNQFQGRNNQFQGRINQLLPRGFKKPISW